jgi:hypothetical protein
MHLRMWCSNSWRPEPVDELMYPNLLGRQRRPQQAGRRIEQASLLYSRENGRHHFE